MPRACGQIVDGLRTGCVKSPELSAQSTAGPKYLTSQVFFMRSLCAILAEFRTVFSQSKTLDFCLLLHPLSTVSPRSYYYY